MRGIAEPSEMPQAPLPGLQPGWQTQRSIRAGVGVVVSKETRMVPWPRAWLRSSRRLPRAARNSASHPQIQVAVGSRTSLNLLQMGRRRLKGAGSSAFAITVNALFEQGAGWWGGPAAENPVGMGVDIDEAGQTVDRRVGTVLLPAAAASSAACGAADHRRDLPSCKQQLRERPGRRCRPQWFHL